jgi:hypothetical protein
VVEDGRMERGDRAEVFSLCNHLSVLGCGGDGVVVVGPEVETGQ